MNFRQILALFFLLCFFKSEAQKYPQNYFRSPIDSALQLSATFCDLRTNHFHSGIDIRTFEQEGLPVYATADGHIARIKISAFGYGKAIYMDHPNGYTTVYAHLSKIHDSLASYVFEEQYKKRSFETDLFPAKGKFKFHKGDLIGWSGNSGGSTGPHLHYEIRNTKSEHPLNPLLFGLQLQDTIKPVFKSIAVYNLDDYHSQQEQLIELSINSNPNKEIRVTPGTKGIGILCHDKINSEKEYGIYSIELSTDTIIYSLKFDELDFDLTKTVNVHIDYKEWAISKRRIQKCFIDDGDPALFITSHKNKGKFQLDDKNKLSLKIAVTDFNGNKTEQNFLIAADAKIPDLPPLPRDVLFYPGVLNLFEEDGFSMEIPAYTFFDTVNCSFKKFRGIKGKDLYSPGPESIPLNRNYSVSIKKDSFNIDKKENLLLVKVDENGKENGINSELIAGAVTGRTNSFGNFTISADSTPPLLSEISKIAIPGFTQKKESVYFNTADDISGLSDYKAEFNGKWTLLEFDAKYNLLIWTPDKYSSGSGILTITVTDKKKNSTTLSKNIK